jgi:hypothetical protein
VPYDPLIPAIGFVLLVGMASLYATGSNLYRQVLSYWMVTPWDHPFIDTAAIPLFIRCWHEHGLVVYTEAAWAACGVGPLIYSPLWLRLWFIPTDPAWTNWLGLSLVLAFLLSLGLLPQSRRSGARAITILATFSGLPLFAMERANVDLIIFVVAVCMARCLAGTFSRRTLGYGLMLLCGLLKFYPLVALVLILRERLMALTALVVAMAAIVAASSLYFLPELRLLTAPPGGAPFHNLWGARNLMLGFPVVLREFLQDVRVPAPVTSSLSTPLLASTMVFCIMPVSMFLIAQRLGKNDDLRAALGQIPALARSLLVIGGALVAGCFFAGQNVGYRGVLLLLILPGVLALRRVSAGPGQRRIWTVTVGAMLCVLWQPTTRHLIADMFGGSYFPVEGSLVGYAVWLIQELAWWWLANVLVAILVRFVAASPIWQDLGLAAASQIEEKSI